MFALRCFACFHALMKKERPKMSTTGVLSAHIMKLAQGACMKNMPMTTSGVLSPIDAHRRCFSEVMRARWIASRSAVASCSSLMSRS